MKKLTFKLLMILFITAPVSAWDQTDPDKPTSHIRSHEVFDTKVGGEDIASAIEIEFPFYDSGATCDNLDDYDEACPYTGSTSPDVVYTFFAHNSFNVRVDLCGSLFDTKVYIYDENMLVIACNDDFYTDDTCGFYVSRLEDVPVQSGNRYYIVIDGYGGDCGEYVLQVDKDCVSPPCLDAICLEDGLTEDEPALVDGYQDVFNSGCDSSEPFFQELIMPPGLDELHFCGQTGYYYTEWEMRRDSDWFLLMASGYNIHIETNSSHFMPTDCDILYLDGCTDISTLPFQMGVCVAGVIDIPTFPGEIIYLRVRPSSAMWLPCADREDLYTLKIQGIGESVVAVEDVFWGSMKSYYR